MTQDEARYEYGFGIESFLEPDSDFIEELCDHLEAEGIHLTSDLLVQILSKYEDHKFSFFKELIEQLVGADNMALPTDGGTSCHSSGYGWET